MIPARRNFQGLEGSNEIYAWRATHSYLPQLEALFVACYCINCRSGRSAACNYRRITHSLVAGNISKFFNTHELPQPGGAALGHGSDSD